MNLKRIRKSRILVVGKRAQGKKKSGKSKKENFQKIINTKYTSYNLKISNQKIKRALFFNRRISKWEKCLSSLFLKIHSFPDTEQDVQ